MTADTRPIKVFYSYAYEDEALRKTLETHLRACEKTPWHPGLTG